MKILKVALTATIVFLLTVSCALSEDIRCVDNAAPGSDEMVMRSMVDQVISASYPFDPMLYSCYMSVDMRQIDYYWKFSNTVIFRARVSDEDQIEIEYNNNYTLASYYDELVMLNGGAFKNWELSRKAWFSSVLPQLCELEVYRQRYINPEWNAEIPPFAQRIMMHKHSEPGKYDVDQDVAQKAALNWLISNEILSEEEVASYSISVFFHTDISTEPRWCLQLCQRYQTIYEINVDARTGQVVSVTFFVQ